MLLLACVLSLVGSNWHVCEDHGLGAIFYAAKQVAHPSIEYSITPKHAAHHDDFCLADVLQTMPALLAVFAVLLFVSRRITLTFSFFSARISAPLPRRAGRAPPAFFSFST